METNLTRASSLPKITPLDRIATALERIADGFAYFLTLARDVEGRLEADVGRSFDGLLAAALYARDDGAYDERMSEIEERARRINAETENRIRAAKERAS